jgi:nucleotide-binding universal stress UspA family protein
MVQPNARKYLVCVTDNDESRVALKMACIKAKHHGGKVTVVHVIPPTDGQTLFTVAERLKEEQRSAAETFIKQMCESAFALTGIMPVIDIRDGNVGDEIVCAALEDGDYILMVLGFSESSGSAALMEWLCAQMGKKLLIPIMVVPGNLTDQQMQSII